MTKARQILEFLRNYQKISKSNSELIIQFNILVNSLISILNYNFFLKKKKKLLKKLEISKLKFKSDEMTSKTDLMNKLSEDINENKKKLKYREEDYLFLKNKKDQISKNIENLNLKIQELNTKKKECFNQINKITREMSEGSQQIK